MESRDGKGETSRTRHSEEAGEAEAEAGAQERAGEAEEKTGEQEESQTQGEVINGVTPG
jgi:hypothetical protein